MIPLCFVICPRAEALGAPRRGDRALAPIAGLWAAAALPHGRAGEAEIPPEPSHAVTWSGEGTPGPGCGRMGARRGRVPEQGRLGGAWHPAAPAGGHAQAAAVLPQPLLVACRCSVLAQRRALLRELSSWGTLGLIPCLPVRNGAYPTVRGM